MQRAERLGLTPLCLIIIGDAAMAADLTEALPGTAHVVPGVDGSWTFEHSAEWRELGRTAICGSLPKVSELAG